jgi:hypothetical protein
VSTNLEGETPHMLNSPGLQRSSGATTAPTIPPGADAPKMCGVSENARSFFFSRLSFLNPDSPETPDFVPRPMVALERLCTGRLTVVAISAAVHRRLKIIERIQNCSTGFRSGAVAGAVGDTEGNLQ